MFSLPPNFSSILLQAVSNAVFRHEIWSGSVATYPSVSAEQVFNALKLYWKSLTPHTLRLSRNGRIHPHTALSIHEVDQSLANRMSPEVIRDYFADGYTLIYRHLEDRHPDFAELCHFLSDVLCAWPSINLYMTPANAQGFAAHTDDHDVLAVQCFGKKDWSIGALPDAVETVTLSSGNVLYIPEGITHSARTSDEVSIHITIGFRPPTLDQYFGWLSERLRSSGKPPVYLDLSSAGPHQLSKELYQALWSEYVLSTRKSPGNPERSDQKL